MSDIKLNFRPALVGERGPTGPQGTSIASATVNPVTGHLLLTLSNGTILDAGAVSAEQATYTIDLTNTASVAVARSGDVLAQTGDNTATVVTANQPIIETMDGWTGVWSHKAITNLFAWNFATGFTDVGSPTIATAQADPAGGTSAIKVTDANSAASSYRYASGTSYAAMIWARADATNPPTTAGCVTGNLGVVDAATTEAVAAADTAWTRLEFGAGAPTSYGYLDSLQMIPAGAAAPGSFTVSATGAAHYYWPFATSDVTASICPMAKTAIPAAGVQLAPAAVAAIAVDGTLDVELEFLPSWLSGASGYVNTYLWSANAGAHSLRTDVIGQLILRINGVDRLTGLQMSAGQADAAQVGGVRGQLVRVRAWWDVIRGECGLRMSVGGSTAYDKTTTASGVTFSPFADFWIGSNGASTTGVMTARHRKLVTRKSASRAIGPQGIFLGDSTIASYYLVGGGPVPGFIYAWSEQQSDRVRCIAVPGDTVTQQKTRWLALSSTERAAASWVAIQVGLNDLLALSDSAATIIARIQDLVTTVRASNATCKILIGQMIPCKQRWIDIFGATDGAATQTKFLAINTAIASTITGVDARVTAYTTTLSDGSGNLAATYDTGDHIHENNDGRRIIADDYRTALISLGLI